MVTLKMLFLFVHYDYSGSLSDNYHINDHSYLFTFNTMHEFERLGLIESEIRKAKRYYNLTKEGKDMWFKLKSMENILWH